MTHEHHDNVDSGIETISLGATIVFDCEIIQSVLCV